MIYKKIFYSSSSITAFRSILFVKFIFLNGILHTGHSKNKYFRFDECDSPTHNSLSDMILGFPIPVIGKILL
jgi:hypothetical protein